MALKAILETLEGLDEATAALYRADGDVFVLDIDGINPVGVTKKNAELLAELKKMKDAQSAAEAAAAEQRKAELTRQQQFETLAKESQAQVKNLEAKLVEVRRQYAQEKCGLVAEQIATRLSADPARQKLAVSQVMALIDYDAESGAVTFRDGLGSAEDVAKRIAKDFPFLADANNSSGGGAAGGGAPAGGGGSADKRKFTDYQSGELARMRQNEPERYSALLAAHKKGR